jgi:diguanylate cyclase (GGDEF)-like protein
LPHPLQLAKNALQSLVVLTRIRRSLALKLILASAIPSAVVLLAGESVLVAHSQKLALRNPALAFEELRSGVVLGTLLALTFAGIAIALAARHFLVKPIQALKQVMARAEMGEFLVRAKVESSDELGSLSRGFNTMLSRVTDMAIADIETRDSMEQMQRELNLQEELKAANEQLEAHVIEMELLLEISRALGGTIDLPEQIEILGEQFCARFRVTQFSLMLYDEATQELVVEATAGDFPANLRGMRFVPGQGVSSETARTGKRVYVTDIEQDPRYQHTNSAKKDRGSMVSLPLIARGHVLGVLNLTRPIPNAFSPQEIRLAEAVAGQAALSIANARLYQETLELSFTDPLTGVANRRQLFVRLDQELSRSVRFGDPLSVLMLDLDLFKQVNDRHGHTVGDGVLRALAAVLKRNVRKIDLVARYGGEEFCIILPRVAKPEAMEVAEKLRRAVAAAVLPGPQKEPQLSITVSVGVASLATDAIDAKGLVERADAALYEAKRLGRDRVASSAPAAFASA